MEFKDLPMPFQEMAANVVRSQLATLDLSTVEKETIDTISGNVRRAFIGLYEEKRLFGGQNSPENKNQANDEKLKHIIALLWKTQNVYSNWNQMQAQRPAFGLP